MHQFFLNEPLTDLDQTITLSRKEYQHAFVLRLREGEEFVLSDGYGQEHLCEVLSTDKNTITARRLESREAQGELDCKLVLLQGLPKRDKLELIIQKAVELGAHQIMPVMMKRTNVKLDDKKADRKAELLQEISKSAATQAKRGIIPEVTGVTAFREALANVADADIKLICYEDETSRGTLEALLPTLPQAKKIALLVGPEGGISEEEWQLAKDAGFQSVSLGKRILRTETAGFCLLSYLMLHLENA